MKAFGGLARPRARGARVSHAHGGSARRRGPAAATAKMFVPSDSFGGKSPERKAADAMRTLFTFASVKIVLAQLEGSGRGNLASYNARDYQDLMAHLESMPMTNGGDEWVARLLEKNEMLGMRVMEVREAYCRDEFEWSECQRLAAKDIQDANVRLLRKFAEERVAKSTTHHPIWPAPDYAKDDLPAAGAAAGEGQQQQQGGAVQAQAATLEQQPAPLQQHASLLEQHASLEQQQGAAAEQHVLPAAEQHIQPVAEQQAKLEQHAVPPEQDAPAPAAPPPEPAPEQEQPPSAESETKE